MFKLKPIIISYLFQSYIFCMNCIYKWFTDIFRIEYWYNCYMRGRLSIRLCTVIVRQTSIFTFYLYMYLYFRNPGLRTNVWTKRGGILHLFVDLCGRPRTKYHSENPKIMVIFFTYVFDECTTNGYKKKKCIEITIIFNFSVIVCDTSARALITSISCAYFCIRPTSLKNARVNIQY